MCTYLGLLALLEERILTRLVGSLVLGEVTILASLLQNLLVYTLDVDRGGSGDNIAGVYPSQGNTVDFEGTSDEENTLGKVLEDNDALAAEATSEEDNDGTGLEGLTGLRRVLGLAGLRLQLVRVQSTHLGASRSACRDRSNGHVASKRLQQCLHAAILMSPCERSQVKTYLLGNSDVVRRIVLARLLRVVRYRPLPLGELLGGGVRVLFVGRHFDVLLSLVALELFDVRYEFRVCGYACLTCTLSAPSAFQSSASCYGRTSARNASRKPRSVACSS
ncbi:hypothetical protein J1614_001285 [Plenodomus biglobosus]|nr:hypothetical protein J1614_001285 [Plenodomus biglobosus]